MQSFESAATRILSPLSELLHRPLRLVDSQSSENGHAFAVRLPMPRVSIVASDGRPFAEMERRLIEEMFDVLRLVEESEARYEELEHRMLSLQRENLDLTVRNRLLSEVSSRDSLTGLYNRWFVMEKIDSELNRSLRHGSPMSLLMLDVDHFKRINDTWGHSAGDQVLQGIGKLLRDCCRVYDVPGRYGGEEFCIVLPETKIGNTSVVAERIRRRLEDTALQCGETSIAVTASIGIAGMDTPDDGHTLSPAGLIERADRALYSAKNRGRNRVELWDSALLDVDDASGH
ncbi:MAG TPA: GGDEF domain-containing protein [Thermoanaerobaculia bacterium]|jgi:diguanylate cyclase (GGDEF)-like protein|nr:GGDEF domain-containing protein [Thermoanaerobaculia bacterium]